MKTLLQTTILILATVLCLLPASSARADDGAVQCGLLIYGGTHTSKCFSHAFLAEAQRKTTIPTERRYRSVKLGSDELFKFPFVIMTGESDFFFLEKERENLKTYLTSGGFLLASAGCSNEQWDQAFRREMRRVFPEYELVTLPMDHPIFRTVYEIKELNLKSGGTAQLEGIEINGKIVAIYSHHGLNDTANTSGCCCCGGNEIKNSQQANINIFAYALLH